MTVPHRSAVAILTLVLAGCVSLSKPAPEMRHYRLDYPPPAGVRQALPVVLRIVPIRTAVPYSGLDILYRESDHDIGAYPYDRWAADPGNMVTDLLVRDFATSQRYRAVEKAPSALQADYELSGHIEKIEEQSVSECQVAVEMRMLLRPLASDDRARILFQKRYGAHEPCGDGGARTAVASFSSAVERISSALQEDVYRAISGAAE